MKAHRASRSQATAMRARSGLIDPVPERDPEVAARRAGLRHVNADEPGLLRRKRGRGFSYRRPDGTLVRDAETLGRIRALAIPPAWTQVWICLDAKGHIQAGGRDARGRKQYRYHARWRAVRDAAKFEHLIDFAHALPKIRHRVMADLEQPGLTHDKVIAAVVRLLDSTFIRVGNEEYARQNSSFGLTTLRRRHVSVEGSAIDFSFRGKSGKRRNMHLDDARLAKVVRRCQELPGQRLFRYLDPDGEAHDVNSDDVNHYLRAVSQRDITSKDVRTWGATVAAALALLERGPKRTKKLRTRSVVEAVECAATTLGNTAAVCRRSYIHPAVIECYLAGDLCEQLRRCRASKPRPSIGLNHAERTVLRFLEEHHANASGAAATRAA